MMNYINAGITEYLSYHTPDDVVNNLLKGIYNINKEFLLEHKNCNLFCGSFVAFNPSLCDFFNAWSEVDSSLLLLSEVTAENRKSTDKTIKFPHFFPPHLLAKNIFIENMAIEIGLRYKDYCNKDPLLSFVVYLLDKKMHLGDGYAYLWTFSAKMYINNILIVTDPKCVYLWNQYDPFHVLFAGLCKRKCIAVRFVEYGCVPGTLLVDPIGQQGTGFVARHWFKFRMLHVNKKNIESAQEVIKYVNEKGLNRYVQHDLYFNNLEIPKSGIKILLIGQYDIESGIFPHDGFNEKYNNSPLFSSSLQVLDHFLGLCKENRWILMFRQHPISRIRNETIDTETSYIDVSDYNLNAVIDASDVVITISSQVSYMSLFRKKAVVMLGRNELYMKGCTYWVKRKESIPTVINRALKEGVTTKQWKNFERHIAQMLKYYLYDDLSERDLRYGKSIDDINGGIS